MKTAARRAGFTLAASIATTLMLLPVHLAAETAAVPSINPTQPLCGRGQVWPVARGREWGGVIALTPDRDGKSIGPLSAAAGGASTPICQSGYD